VGRSPRAALRGACGLILALGVLGCGATAHRTGTSTTSSTSTTTTTTSTTPGLATASTDVCVAKGRDVIARYAHLSPAKVGMRRGHDNSGAANCRFGAGRLVVSVSVSGAPQPYAVMERQAEEEAQIFGAKRLVPAPQYIAHEGIDAYWFPRERYVETTDAVNLITATIVRWPGVPRRRWKRLAEAVARPYLGRLRPDLARGPAP
jgi:hypothetical protein